MAFQISEKSEPTICLNMIVKNEAHIIQETLRKLCEKISFSYWVICDTGSTDDTPKIIKDFFKTKQIPGEMFHDQWVNFSHNRTLALNRAFKKTDLLFVFDADDEIVGEIKMPSEVSHDEYHLQFGSEMGSSYTRVLLINNQKPFEYKSVIHEFIACKESGTRAALLEGNYYVVSGRTSARNKDPEKYLKDAKILETAYKNAKITGDLLFHRYAFYCANSYKDYGSFENAIEWYKVVLSHEHQWDQEKYMACVSIYECFCRLNQKENGFFYLVNAFSFDRERVECLYYLINHYCVGGMNDIAYYYYLMCKDFYENKYLSSNIQTKLFAHNEKYNFLLPFYMILVCDKVKIAHPEANKTISKMFEIIFTKKTPIRDDFFIGNLLYNLQFFIRDAIQDVPNFIPLFQSYINFLESLNINIAKHEFLKLYEEHGIIFKHKQTIATNFSKEECEQSKKILIYSGFCDRSWNYTYSIGNALGGSETAICRLAKCFPKNYEVYIAGHVQEEVVDNIHFVNFDSLKRITKEVSFHTLIVSRYLAFYEMFPETSFYQSFIWGHDIALFNYGCDISVHQILEKWSDRIHGCICQTEWHMNLFKSMYPQLTEKMHIINNGIELDKFSYASKKIENRFIYSSCSERGLDKLLDIWPEIIRELPNAELYICSYNSFPRNEYENALNKTIQNYDSIKHVGCLNRDKLYQLMSSCEYWLYPTNFSETSCITSMEMLMSEVICIYYPLAGLVNTLGDYGLSVSKGQEVETILNLTNKQKSDIRKRGKEYSLSCIWENRFQLWSEILFKKNTETLSEIEKNNIKVINLKKRDDRKTHTTQQLARENITKYEFIEAIDGNDLVESDEIRLLFEGNNFNYKKGIIGCALSHVKLWKDLAQDNKNDYYVVLEDDLELSPGFKEKLELHCKIFEEKKLEHLSLGVYECNYTDQEKIATADINIFEKDVYKFWNITFAYIISKSAAIKMISHINKCSIKCAIDNPRAYGEVIKFHHTTCCIAKQKNVYEVGTDIQNNHNTFNFNKPEEGQNLRIAYCDWWNIEYCGGTFDLQNNFLTDVLKKYGNIDQIDIVQPHEKPDILFYSIFGNEYTKYPNVRRVFFSGEPFGIREDADCNVTFDRNSDKNTRFPLWLGYLNDYLLDECNRRKNGMLNVPKRERFCSFIAAGEVKTTHRRTIVEKLSAYKKVHCGGGYLNNIGYMVPRGENCSGKIEHNNNYKFAIAFENEDYPGYVTEKICDIYKSNCVPIYWGTKEVVRDFNPATFINANDFDNFDELVDYIIKVDNDDDLYSSYFSEPFFSNKWMDVFNDPNKSFFKNLADSIIGKRSCLVDNYFKLDFARSKVKHSPPERMKVIFSNNCSVGDIFFSQPFIKNIVTNNPEHDYYIYHQTTSYYFTDILDLNIKDVNKLPSLKEQLYNIFNFKIEVDSLVNIHNMSSYPYRYDKTNNILLICTWLGVLRETYKIMVECNLISYNEFYKFFIEKINIDLSFNLKYDDTLSLDVYPCVPTLNIDSFRGFKKSCRDKKVIFYHNWLPSSGQKFPIKNYEEHNQVISFLAEKNIVIIADKNSYVGNNENVYFADDFVENVEYYDAKNFYYHAQMAYESEYAIYYDSGRNFMYLNKIFIEENNKNTRIHLGNTDYYYEKLNRNSLVPIDYAKFIMVSDAQDIISELKKNIFRTSSCLEKNTKICFDIEENKGDWSLKNINNYDKIVSVEASEIIHKTNSIDKLVETHGIPELIITDLGFEFIKLMNQKYNIICFKWTNKNLVNTINSANYVYKLGYRKFYIQMNNDEYTFKPNENDYFDIKKAKEILTRITSKCEWGMIWCI